VAKKVAVDLAEALPAEVDWNFGLVPVMVQVL
jgi:hypothetical protein